MTIKFTKETAVHVLCFVMRGTEERLVSDSAVLIPCYITIGQWVEMLLLRGKAHMRVHEYNGTLNLLTCEIYEVREKVLLCGFTCLVCGRSISSSMLRRYVIVPSVATDKGPIF
jgi:hypothetical protein